MDEPDGIISGLDRFSALPEFVSVLDTGPHPIGQLSLLTHICDHDNLHGVIETINDTAVVVVGAGWCHDGLVLDFANVMDKSLFTLAFRGPLTLV